MLLIKVNVQWGTPESQRNTDLGIDIDEDDQVINWKPIVINTERIAFIEEYKGFCCFYFSGGSDDFVLTDIPAYKIDEIFPSILTPKY